MSPGSGLREDHVAKDRDAQAARALLAPLTGLAVDDRVITDLCVGDVTPEGFRLVELAPGVDLDAARAASGAPSHA